MRTGADASEAEGRTTGVSTGLGATGLRTRVAGWARGGSFAPKSGPSRTTCAGGAAIAAGACTILIACIGGPTMGAAKSAPLPEPIRKIGIAAAAPTAAIATRPSTSLVWFGLMPFPPTAETRGSRIGSLLWYPDDESD